MKRLYLLSQILIVIFFAISPFLPFAGKVTYIGPAACGELIAIKPIGFAPPGPYANISGVTKSYLYGTVLPQSWIIGLYNPVMVPCSPPPTPILAFPIIMYGVSLPGL